MAKQYKTVMTHFSKYLPPGKVTNDDLSKLMDTNDAWITERSGIKERRFVEEPVATSDLAIEAVKNVLAASNLKPSDFDYIIASTLSPDYYFPGIAPIVQHKLGFPTIPAVDIRVQCSAFVYSTQMADAMIKSGQYKRILLVFSDVQSKMLDLTTKGRNVAVLFGDGAAAAICEAVECTEDEMPSVGNMSSGVIDTILGSDGLGAELLLTRSPGTATKGFLSAESVENGDWHPTMEGRSVFKHAVTRMCEVAETLMKRHNITANDLVCLVPHQANLRISEMVREKMELPKEKVFNNIHCYGNTTSATIPICINEALEQGRLKKGDLIMTVAFGAGFTWGASLIRL
ncbi:3-oxoacyl-ACP synthase III family protein [Fluviispira multicolorata]|uniref:Beta-ketoacyl-ACP synthase III n=1 Tax=Fluviispira multicolorata TaxID=2654512 RepID=A0A833JE20_9BACT|nr:beta-ketoacyl-ACP synthase III [Fluviispira multicolorata]KAB8031037.1 beta-ketoacyl-ACP synthase III [Fluviispira multicolorata]